MITNGDNALNENNEKLLPNLPRSILEDDYFKQNLPPTYGTVSLPPSENDTDDRLGEFAFERDFKLCSKGYQELSNNLSAYGQSKVSWTASYQNTESIFNQPEEHDIRLGIKRGGLLSEPGYGQMNENLSSIFQSKESERETTMSENFFPSTECHKHSNNNHFNLRIKENEKSDIKSVHPYDTSSIIGISSKYGASKSNNTNTMENGLHNNTKNNIHNNTNGGEQTQDIFIFDPLRYQNVTYDNLGESHTAVSVDVRPYGIAKFNFFAQFDNELSLQEGGMVYLKKYIDDEWMEGEIDGKRGLIPIGYINIIVDCLELVDKSSKEISQATSGDLEPINKPLDNNMESYVAQPIPLYTASTLVSNKIKPGTYHKVRYTFQAQMEGDLNIVEGEVIRVLEKGNENVHWLNVENSYGESGLCPSNHLDSTEEFDGKVLFDIDRLLSYKNQKEQSEKVPTKDDTLVQKRHYQSNNAPIDHNSSKADIKFFDPLCSPDNDMLMVEAELERKAKEANTMPIQETVARKRREQLAKLSAIREGHQDTTYFAAPEKKKLRNKEVATNIDDFISTNISKLESVRRYTPSKPSSQPNVSIFNGFVPNNNVNLLPKKNTNPFTSDSHLTSCKSEFTVKNEYENVSTQKGTKYYKDKANLASSQLDISKSILLELRGNKPKPRKPAPPRPLEPPKLQTMHGHETNGSSKNDENQQFDNFGSFSSSKTSQSKSSKPPPKPPPPLRNSISDAAVSQIQSSGFNIADYSSLNSNQPTATSTFDCLNRTECSQIESAMEEPLYAKVKKSLTSTYSLSETSSNQVEELSLNSRLPTPPGRKPPRPPKLQAGSEQQIVFETETTPTKLITSGSSFENDSMTAKNLNEENGQTLNYRYDDVYSANGSVVGQKDTKDTANEVVKHPEDGVTSTNESSRGYPHESQVYQSASVYSPLDKRSNDTMRSAEGTKDFAPKVPQRTSSCSMKKVINEWHQRNMNININKSLNSVTQHSSYPATKENGGSSRGYINTKDFSSAPNGKFNHNGIEFNASIFPPDKDSPMSPPPSENPPKIQTLPYRCVSVGSSSIKSRSVFYASV